MSNPYRVSKQRSPQLLLRQELRRNPVSGFSLIELLVAMSLFLVVGGAAITLVRRHMPMFNTAQNQTSINIALRNAVAQLQMEVVNAGTGFSGATPIAFSPMGATITKATNAACKTPPANYVAGCFDSLQLISVDSTVPPLSPSADAAGLTQVDTTGATTIYLTMPGNPAGATGAYLSSLKAGSELMLIQGGTDVGASGKPAISIVVLQSDAVASGNAIKLTTTAATQSGVSCGAGTVSGVPAAGSANDLLGIYDAGECDRFIGTFKPQWDYVVKLVAGSKYSVDATTDPTNPKLVRTNAGVQDIIAEQIIGFTVGAWSSQRIVGGVVSPGYTITPADYSSDWASVRSIQVQIVARATPNTDSAAAFTNTYDQGNYQVQGISVVINPRNLNTN